MSPTRRPRRFAPGRITPALRALGCAVLVWASSGTPKAWAQEDNRYLLGPDRQLEMIVHIIGEVKSPGEYRVRDNTTALDLLSKAGGPTEFANLGAILLRHTQPASPHPAAAAGPAVLKINLGKYLKDASATPPPVLQPGDVVSVPGNGWRKWRNGFSVVRDLAVVASAYFLYVRSTKDN